MNVLRILFLFLSTLTFADIISVDLKTQNKSPTYLLLRVESPMHPASYIKEIQKIVQFDLQFSPFSEVIESKKTSGLDRPFWKTIGASYVVRSHIRKDSLFLEVLNVKTGALRAFLPLTLSGTLTDDRTLIHQYISDLIFAFFKVKSIHTKKILYSLRTKKEDQWISEIWVCDFDGHHAKQITFNDSYSTCAKFFPDGKSFLYVSYQNEQPKIIKAKFNEPKGEELLTLRGSQALPSISRTGREIAFISDAAGRPDLFLQYLDGQKKPLQLFSYPRATQASSSFSPDGKKIAFVSDKDGSPRIYTLNIPRNKKSFKTPKALLITKQNRQNTSPSWSPDGKKLAYSAKTKGVRQIWLYDFDKRDEKQLTFGNINMENPAWSSDNAHIVFNSENDFISELYIMNINQKKIIKITSGPGDKRFPVFEQ